ncbi:MAG TPA: hypothetical protein VLG17_15235 [Pseudomonas sp.]|uniref:hypothetical protein n=1 Tax=Pseudomonas sp. TaxID=306 RepID=UPI002B8FE494|nr:hypothetical protein [Pseudomonas sp.]HSX89334.1 hypothetical protein [Pseudomonas sp.]
MPHKIKTHLLASVLLFIASNGVAETFPTASGDTSSQECADALALANFMFNSKSTKLYAPLSIPSTMNSDLILGTSERDISGGSALEANQDQFEKLPQLGRNTTRSVYWEKEVEGSTRIAVKETNAGWKGDMYSLFLIDSHIQENEFLQDLQESYGHSKYPAFIEGAWRPPLIFLSRSTKTKWFIDVGQPYEFLARWIIYKNPTNKLTESCTIQFRPEIKFSQSLLPKSVQRLAYLLNETMGPGNNEGTLQPTARLRLHTQHIWANAALRPWALSESDVYNSTEEVNTELKAWSKSGLSYKNIHTEIINTYPAAEQELAHYYMKNFKLPKDKATPLANWVLDIAYRAHYIFPNGSDHFRYDNVNTNPWNN